jgi:hypothetical protein
MKNLLIAGTGSWANDSRIDWYTDGSPFVNMLTTRGHPVYFGTDGHHPFIWSTGLGGVWGTDARKLAVWAAAGQNLFDYCVPPLDPAARIPSDELNLIVHSHGLQVALFALQAGLKVHTMISMGSPIRRDVAAATKAARGNVGYWLHVHSDGSDKWQWLGELGDESFGIIRKAPLADRNDFVAGVGHSELLRDPTKFPYWLNHQWLLPLLPGPLPTIQRLSDPHP